MDNFKDEQIHSTHGYCAAEETKRQVDFNTPRYPCPELPRHAEPLLFATPGTGVSRSTSPPRQHICPHCHTWNSWSVLKALIIPCRRHSPLSHKKCDVLRWSRSWGSPRKYLISLHPRQKYCRRCQQDSWERKTTSQPQQCQQCGVVSRPADQEHTTLHSPRGSVDYPRRTHVHSRDRARSQGRTTSRLCSSVYKQTLDDHTHTCAGSPLGRGGN